MYTGTIVRFNATKGYGFIQPDESTDDVFMHATELVEGDEEQLGTGTRVAYQVTTSHKGPKAVKIRIITGSYVTEHAAGYTGDHAEVVPEDTWSLPDEAIAVIDRHVRAMTDELRELLKRGI